MPLPAVVAAPAVWEGLTVAAAWAYRVYRAYRAAKGLEAIIQAQEEAGDNAETKDKTQAQAKADDAASSDCKNCQEDPNCEKWRQNIRRALYGAKQPKALGGGGGGDKGLAQRLCELMHGTGDNPHDQNFNDTMAGIEKDLKKLKNKKQFRCNDSPDLEKEANEYLKQAKDRESMPKIPRADFKEYCYKKAFELAQKFIGDAP
jgi:hypothetical protein